MSHQLQVMTLATLTILAGCSFISFAWAMPAVNPDTEDSQIIDCDGLTNDLQVFVEYGTINSSDVKDVLMLFQCNTNGII
jgi:hypothetical protein